MNLPADPSTSAATARHYQALCGLGLAVIFMIQWQQSTFAPQVALVVGVLMLMIGAVGVLYRARFSPLFVLVAIAAPLAMEQYYARRDFNSDNVRFLNVADVLLCMAVLAYFLGHYRLQGLWFGVLPADPRLRSDAEKPAPPLVRSEESLTLLELTALVFTIPVFALLAEFALLLLNAPWKAIDLPVRWQQFLTLAWTLLLTMFLTAHAFRYWRRQQLDRTGALILLHDILWNETRGEQRRINRWLAWKKIK